MTPVADVFRLSGRRVRAVFGSGLSFTLHALLTGEHRAHHGEMLGEATRLAEAGQLTPRLDPRRFDLGTAEQGYDAITDRSARGKVVVDIV